MNDNITTRPDDGSRTACTLNVLAGIWLIISGWALGFTDVHAALWDTVLVGVAVIVLAAIRLGTTNTTGLSWLNVILGLWLIISPFVLGFAAAPAAMCNTIVLGVLVGIFSLWAAFARDLGAPART